jgi:hypothetical protein
MPLAATQPDLRVNEGAHRLFECSHWTPPLSRSLGGGNGPRRLITDRWRLHKCPLVPAILVCFQHRRMATARHLCRSVATVRSSAPGPAAPRRRPTFRPGGLRPRCNSDPLDNLWLNLPSQLENGRIPKTAMSIGPPRLVAVARICSARNSAGGTKIGQVAVASALTPFVISSPA